jgi:hypothetical protein
MGTEESSHITISAKLPALVTALPRGNTASYLNLERKISANAVNIIQSTYWTVRIKKNFVPELDVFRGVTSHGMVEDYRTFRISCCRQIWAEVGGGKIL